MRIRIRIQSESTPANGLGFPSFPGRLRRPGNEGKSKPFSHVDSDSDPDSDPVSDPDPADTDTDTDTDTNTQQQQQQRRHTSDNGTPAQSVKAFTTMKSVLVADVNGDGHQDR